MPPELGPASSLLDPLRDHALVGTCGDAQLGRALALASSSLPSLAPSKMPATSASRSARSPATSRSSVAPRRFRARLAYASGMPLGYAGEAGNEQTVKGGSGAIMGDRGQDRTCMR